MENISYSNTVQWVVIIGSLLAPVFWRISSTFRYYLKMFIYYVLVISVSAALAFASIPWAYDVTNVRMCQWMMVKFCTILGIKWELRGEEKLKKVNEPCIVICNHQSALDIMGMMEVWPNRCAVMMKKELKYACLLGAATVLTGGVLIDRYNKDKAIEACNKTLAYITEVNAKLWVFPEGTRSRDGTMLPFKKGAFHLAIQGQIPIAPIVFSKYSHFCDHRRKKFRSGGYMIVEVLEPIPTKGLTIDDIPALSEQARLIMMNVYDKISPEAAEKFESEKLLRKSKVN